MTSKLAVIPRDWSYPVAEYRSSLENPQTPLSYPAEWLLDIFQGGRTDAGIRVSELTAFQVSTFLTCTDLIAGKISSLPFDIQERSFSKNSNRAVHRVAYDHDYYDLIHYEPNAEMSRQTFMKAFLLHALAWGNGYAEIQRNVAGEAVAFWPRNPSKTRPRRLRDRVRLPPEDWRPWPLVLDAGTLVFGTTDGIDDQDGSETGATNAPDRIIPMGDMLHIPGLSFDGRLGQSVVWLARQTIGLALATEKFGAKYFANFARPGGLLTLPMNMKAEDKEQARRSWLEAEGGENSHRIAVMPPGFEWKPMSNNPQEAQTIESRTYIRTEIASLFHVPVRMVGDTSKASKASTEQENQELLDYTLDPWMSAIKLEWKRKLFPHSNIGRTPKNRFFVSFDVTSMIRGDAQSRERFNASGRQWGYLNANDVLALEGLNPVDAEWAEQYWMPVNMTLTTTPINPNYQDGSGQGADPNDPTVDPNDPLKETTTPTPKAVKTPPGSTAGSVPDDADVEDNA